MLGSYGPHPNGEPYVKNFDTEESPSGMLARSGTYHVRSRVVDDDGEVYAGMSMSLLRPDAVVDIVRVQTGTGPSRLGRNGRELSEGFLACICLVASIPPPAYLSYLQLMYRNSWCLNWFGNAHTRLSRELSETTISWTVGLQYVRCDGVLAAEKLRTDGDSEGHT